MTTSAHVVFNLVVLGRPARAHLFMPIALGAILPDVPMFVFYAYQKLMRVSEHVIWADRFRDPVWQASFDVPSSIPALALVAALAWPMGAQRVTALCASMGLHGLCDLVLHHNDGHRHFLPFSNWRFESPVSYWDPRHYGDIVGPIEILGAVVGAIWLFRAYPTRGPRVFLAVALACYAGYITYATLLWR